ncbi:nucleotidyltransferase [candidate division TA06 bacterium]|nr:nucleotidyltransferase [candidate division TA06 bacterium]
MILKTLKEIAQLLIKGEIPYMVIGGQATLQYGVPRFTEDIDITVALTPKELDQLLKLLQKKFRVLPKDPLRFVQETWVLPVEHQKTKVRVDLVFSVTLFEQESIQGARKIQVEGIPIHYISPEDLVVQKIVAGRPRDIEDAKGVLQIQGKTLDRRKIAKKLRVLSLGKEAKEILNRWERLKKGKE